MTINNNNMSSCNNNNKMIHFVFKITKFYIYNNYLHKKKITVLIIVIIILVEWKFVMKKLAAIFKILHLLIIQSSVIIRMQVECIVAKIKKDSKKTNLSLIYALVVFYLID